MTYPTEKMIDVAAKAIYEITPLVSLPCVRIIAWGELSNAAKKSYLDAARAALIAYEQAAWETIDKAPKGAYWCFCYDKHGNTFKDLLHDGNGFKDITHFRPLPTPPKQGGE